MALRIFAGGFKSRSKLVQIGSATLLLSCAVTMGPRLLSTSAATSSFKLISQIASIPHPEKVAKGGEDAFFVSKNGYAVGVADGVGGWASQGVDPSIYSKSLMKWSDSFASGAKEDGSFPKPKEVIDFAWKKSMGIAGSSTAVVAILQKDSNVLSTANLGDSGFMVVRKGKMIYRSMEQTKGFNFPFQLGGDPRSSDSSKDAFEKDINVEKGDLLVVGSDGLFDNMFDQEILSVLEESIAKSLKLEAPPRPKNMEGPSKRPNLEDIESNHKFSLDTTMKQENFEKIQAIFKSNDNLAMEIAKIASVNGKSQTKITPFSKSAKEHRFNYLGGKEDDITVIVSLVVDAPLQSKL